MAISTFCRNLQQKLLKTVHRFFYQPPPRLSPNSSKEVTLSPSTYIRSYGDPVLQQQCAAVPRAQIKSDKIQAVIKHMLYTMKNSQLVGLAAPQIGVPLRIIMVEFTEAHIMQHPVEYRRTKEMITFPLKIFINPELKVTDAQVVTFHESCASVRFGKQVTRARGVEVTGLNEDGKSVQWSVTGWPARILQHEVDHLNGILNIDVNGR